MITVRDIIIKELKSLGADGLFIPDECHCYIDNPMPCTCASNMTSVRCIPAKFNKFGKWEPIEKVEDKEYCKIDNTLCNGDYCLSCTSKESREVKP